MRPARQSLRGTRWHVGSEWTDETTHLLPDPLLMCYEGSVRRGQYQPANGALLPNPPNVGSGMSWDAISERNDVHPLWKLTSLILVQRM